MGRSPGKQPNVRQIVGAPLFAPLLSLPLMYKSKHDSFDGLKGCNFKIELFE